MAVNEMIRPARHWTEADVPDQDGRAVLVTGANSGLGFRVAAVLAARGAKVVLACRDTGKARDAAGRISTATPGASTEIVRLDLASLASVREAAAEVRSHHASLDLLINNGGVMIPPRSTTEDGFELQLGTNHLGHFALTGLLLDRLLATPGSRVVTVSSAAHRLGRVNFDDLQSAHRYRRSAAYAQSKLANLMFALELQRRLAAAAAQTASLAAHPGYSRTNLARHMPAALERAAAIAIPLLSQDPSMGALPVLRAASDPAARGGQFYGPGGLGQLTGYPKLVAPAKPARDTQTQRRLWAESERLTGVTYPL
jgi:NAD(P)-dependent dehydrogenase (short-subunit alcohol dehydrogenase family)